VAGAVQTADGAPKLMKRRFFLVVVLGLSLPLFSGCNLYSSFAGPNNDEEYVQEAQKCLREGNYTCAIDNYSKIVSTELKNEKLCLVQLTRGGLGIAELVNTIASSSGATMMGRLATALMPWTEDKQTGMEAAVVECNKLSTIANVEKQALLRTIAYLSECAVKMAKADQFVATSEATDACNATTAGNQDGELTAGDIAASNASVDLSGVNTGMCKVDVTTCATNLDQANDLSAFLGADLSGVSGNLTNIPADLKNSSAATTAVRQALIDTL
jgi:hypothetical protein